MNSLNTFYLTNRSLVGLQQIFLDKQGQPEIKDSRIIKIFNLHTEL